MKRKNKVLVGALSLSLISLVLFLAFCYSKGVAPFGGNSLELGDAGKQVVPMYYHIWDFLHGDKSLFFDWYTGFGYNMSANVIHYGYISPLNLLLYFTTRENIGNFFIVLLAIRFVLLSLSMYFFLIKKVKTIGIVSAVMLSLLYAFNAYSIQARVLPCWIDVMICLPILMYFLIEMLENGKHKVAYSLMLAFSFMLDFNFVYMQAIFIVTISFLFLTIKCDKERRKVAATNLVLCSAIGIMMSAIILLPGVIQITKSYRFNISSNIFEAIWNGYFTGLSFNVDKWALAILPFLAVVISTGYVLKVKQNHDKDTLLWYLVCILCSLSVIMEGSNLVWNLGTYVGFPMRYSFTLQFSAIYLLALRLSKEDKTIKTNAVLLVMCITAFCLVYIFKDKAALSSASLMMMIAFILAIVGLLSCLILRGRTKGIMINTVALCACLYVCNQCFIIRALEISPEITSYMAEDIKPLVENEDLFERIKNLDDTVQENYPLIVKRSSFSNYLHFISSPEFYYNRDIGNTSDWTMLSDSGGTLITDTLLKYDTVFSKSTLDDELYQTTNTSDLGYSIGTSKYQYPIGFLMEEKATQRKLDNNNTIGNQQIFAEAIMNDHSLSVESFNSDTSEYSIQVIGKSIVYFHIQSDSPVEIMVNNQLLNIMDRIDGDGSFIKTETTFPQFDRNGILNLGVYENETVNIEIKNLNSSEYWASVGVLDLDAFVKSVSTTSHVDCNYVFSKEGLSIETGTVNKTNQYLFLPIYADDGWKVTVNNKSVEPVKLFDVFMVIPLDKGNNVISMKFTPKGIVPGIGICLVGLALLIVVDKFNKKITANSVVNNICEFGSYFVCVIVYLITFVLPTIFFIYTIICSLLG